MCYGSLEVHLELTVSGNSTLNHLQGQRIPCNSEGAQASWMTTINYLGGLGGMLPQENLEFLTSRECF